MSDGDDNDSGADFMADFALVHGSEWFSSSCAKVLFVSSFGIAVDRVVLSLRLHIWYMFQNYNAPYVWQMLCVLCVFDSVILWENEWTVSVACSNIIDSRNKIIKKTHSNTRLNRLWFDPRGLITTPNNRAISDKEQTQSLIMWLMRFAS